MALIGHMGNHGSSARADVAENQILSQRMPFDGIPVRAGIMSLSQRELSRPADVREAGYSVWPKTGLEALRATYELGCSREPSR